MSYKRIVLATDGSPSAETAEHVGATLARSVNGTLTIAHAYEHPDRVEGAVARALRIAEREAPSPSVRPEHRLPRVFAVRAAEVPLGEHGLR